MANEKHLEILARGVEAWNTWRVKTAELADLTDADLSGMELRSFRFDITDLSRAILRCCDLSGANFSAADLPGADLSKATLYGSSFGRLSVFQHDRIAGGAALNGTNFSGASLCDTLFCNCSANQAIFTGAIFSRVRIVDTDLNQSRGLDTVTHLSPSSIDLETVYRSGGNIPDSFLRGAGVPENFITYLKSLTGSAFAFYSCFISYSTKDQDFADRLYADLQAKGVRCWFAPHDIQGGKKVHEQIDEAIRVYDKLLLILSDASMNSPWVRTEIANARARETQQQRQMLFPISLVPFGRIGEWKCFDADAGIDSAREIREYFVPDFSNWKDHDSYSRAFERLVRDLKAGTNKGAAEGAP